MLYAKRVGCQFLVKWKGSAKLEWVPKKNLGGTNCPLQKFDDARFFFSEYEEMLLSKDDHNLKKKSFL